MGEIPADLVLDSGGEIRGIENEGLTRAQGLRPHEYGTVCRDCTFLEGTVCTLYTYVGRGKVERIMDRQGTIPNTVQALVTRGEMPISRLPGKQVRYKVNCPRNYVTGTLVLPPKKVAVDSKFFRDRRDTPWVSGTRRRD